MFNGITRIESDDLAHDPKDYSDDFLEKHTNALVKCFLRRKLFRELLDRYEKVSCLEGYFFLNAHGGVNKDGKWIFSDGNVDYVFQDWIDNMDGRALVFFLYSCNPGSAEIHSSSSLVIHPRGDIDVRILSRGGALRLHMPERGYLDSCRDLHKSIDELTYSLQ